MPPTPTPQADDAKTIAEISNRLARLERGLLHQHKIMNKQEAAAYLGRSLWWLEQQHRAGKGPRRRMNPGSRIWSYSRDDLDRFAATFGDDA